jgi:NAD(P)-dependent dehydrogenase (short-subunit alcohol dehydrogenase family)
MVYALAEVDVSKVNGCAAAMAEAVRLWRQVDIPVHNVGISGPASNEAGASPKPAGHFVKVSG